MSAPPGLGQSRRTWRTAPSHLQRALQRAKMKFGMDKMLFVRGLSSFGKSLNITHPDGAPPTVSNQIKCCVNQLTQHVFYKIVHNYHRLPVNLKIWMCALQNFQDRSSENSILLHLLDLLFQKRDVDFFLGDSFDGLDELGSFDGLGK